MSYNIDHVGTPVLDAWLLAKDVVTLHQECGGDLPKSSFLEEMVEEAETAVFNNEGDKRIALPNFWWSDESSGNTYHQTLLLKVAPKIMGHVEVIFTWEGGDSHSGLIIKDGEVTECDVSQKLVPKKKVR
jgi:hypothetical protein